MGLGLLYAISACFLWGIIFVIPQFLADFSAVELVMGRYLIYGGFSAFIFFRKGFSKVRLFSKKVWVMAFIFALLSNVVYYLGIVAGVRYASAPFTVLLIGMAPIIIALYGNWHIREVSYKSLIFPCLWIFTGVVIVNVTEVDWSFSTYSLQHYILGVGGVLVGLFSWCWYAVHNARFLKRNPHILSTDWATAIGVGTLFWVMVMGLVLMMMDTEPVEISRYATRFWVGIVVLGILCSWLGCFLWNRASLYLPVSLMGPFLIFEAIFGLIFVYSYEARLPSLIELLGVSLMLSGILLSVYVFRRQKFSL